MVKQLMLISNLICFALVWTIAFAYNDGSSVLLNDIQVLTLKQGHMTTGRRSSSVPQLTCVGGSAKHLFNPPVVQCYNRGSDGYDIQWECKADMDTSYRFGEVTVTCEGYNHPNDPYVLKGSCGLEYTMELTEEGRQKKGSGSSWGSGSWGSGSGNTNNSHSVKRVGSIIGDVMSLIIIACIGYGVYKCFSGPSVSQPHSRGSDSGTQGSSQPPPPGFRSEYTSQDNCGFGTGTTGSSSTGQTGGHTGGGGFWSGAGLGGVLGYLFGSRGNTYNQYPGYQRPNTSWWGRPYNTGYSNGWGNGWGSGWSSGRGNGWGGGLGNGWGSGRGSGSSWGSSSTSSSSRTTSGFGGTRRR